MEEEKFKIEINTSKDYIATKDESFAIFKMANKGYTSNQIYYEFIHDGKVLARADVEYVEKEKYTGEHFKLYQGYGYKYIPEKFFYLKRIDISSYNQRSKGYGGLFLNYIMSDLEKIKDENGKTYPMLITRFNSYLTKGFYERWGAEYDNKDNENNVHAMDRLMIKNIKSIDMYPFTHIASIDYNKDRVDTEKE